MPNPHNAATPQARRDADPNAASARPAKRKLAKDEKPDQLAREDEKVDAENRQEALLDEAVEESFPASDPPSVKRIT